MHPALSVIIFTTASGAGYGLLVWYGLMSAFSGAPGDRMVALVVLPGQRRERAEKRAFGLEPEPVHA